MKKSLFRRLLPFVMLLPVSNLFCSAQAYSWENDLHHRLLLDFGKTHEDVKAYIRHYIPDVTDEQMDRWEQSRALETMVLDGRKRYFNQAGPNLFRIDPACRALKAKADPPTPEDELTINRYQLPLLLQETRNTPLAEPKRMRVTYSLTVKADAVPEGETVRCWLPFPRTDVARQTDIKLLRTSEKPFKRAPRHAAHSTVYMEKKAVKGEPTVFSETFEFTSYGCHYNLTPESIQPYRKNSKLYKEYTSQRETHIRFTPRLRRLADSLCAGEDNPLLRARRIFKWINGHFPWASAREYSTIPCIPEYVVENRHGDCGQVTLLFLTLCRLSGIPARWQSGFMMHPDHRNLHDWGEVYFEGFGWVPADQSFGIPAKASNDNETYFYLGGIDPWRLIVNSDYSQPLYPRKTYPRSETVDFQRGEVEWQGGNLYFDQWTWDMEVEYL